MLISTLLTLLLVGAPGPQSSGSGSNTANLGQATLHGFCRGQFSVPTPAGPGQMLGSLRAPNGTALFRVHAQVLPDPTSPTSGTIDGVLVRVVGPNPGPIAHVHGVWQHDPVLGNRFHALIVRPPSSTNPNPQPIGMLRGRFQDPNGPLPPDGHFLGMWRIQ